MEVRTVDLPDLLILLLQSLQARTSPASASDRRDAVLSSIGPRRLAADVGSGQARVLVHGDRRPERRGARSFLRPRLPERLAEETPASPRLPADSSRCRRGISCTGIGAALPKPLLKAMPSRPCSPTSACPTSSFDPATARRSMLHPGSASTDIPRTAPSCRPEFRRRSMRMDRRAPQLGSSGFPMFPTQLLDSQVGFFLSSLLLRTPKPKR